jgi:hypothetical protein
MTNSTLKQFLTLIFFLFSSMYAVGQNMNIQGNVVDTAGQLPLQNAVVTLVRIKDSVLLAFTYSDSKGHFLINHVPIDTFSLRISYPKCDESVYFIFADSSNFEFNLQRVVLKPESNVLDEVVIYANKSPIYFRGDTLVYIADSFKVASNAVVEDLLKKLPGIEVESNGKIRVQGRVVDKVLVDGDEFFGSDASIATKNLDAKGVETVEVFEESDKNSLESEEKIQVMNLKMKEEAKKGYFGRLSAASDFQNYYQGECLARKFNQDQKISIYSLVSNTPRTGFNWQEEDEYGIDLRNVTYDEDGGSSWINYTLLGIPQNLKTGFYFSDRYGSQKQTQIRMNYGYSDSQVKSNKRSSAQYFVSDSSYYINNSENSSDRTALNKFSFSVETKLDSLTKITLEPSLSLVESKGSAFSQNQFLNEENFLNRTNTILTEKDGNELNFVNKLALDRNFRKVNRVFKLNYISNYKTNSSVGSLKSSNIYASSFSYTDALDQEKLEEGIHATQNVKLEFKEPLSSKTTFSSSYYFGFNKIELDRLTFNPDLNVVYNLLDSTFSMRTETKRLQHKVGLSILHVWKKFQLGYGVQGRILEAQNINFLLGSAYRQSFFNLLPEANVQYKPSMSKIFRLNYRTESELPRIDQIQAVRDNSNPNNIIIGNSSLESSYKHSFKFMSNIFNGIAGRYMYIYAISSFDQRGFGDSIVNSIEQMGQIVTKTVHVYGNYNGSIFLSGSLNLYKNVIRMLPSLNFRMSKTKNYLNGELNINYYKTFGFKPSVDLIFDSLTVKFSGGIDYTLPSSTLGIGLNKPFYTSVFTSEIRYQLKYGFSIETNAELTMNAKRSDGYNLNYLIWNLSFTKNFFKQENLILSASGNDLLNQNTMANRSVMRNVIVDYQTQVISRYFLLKLTYKFKNKLKISEEDESF